MFAHEVFQVFEFHKWEYSIGVNVKGASVTTVELTSYNEGGQEKKKRGGGGV